MASGWYNELDSITEADPTTDELVVTPKGVKAYTLVSNESVADTQPAIANLIGNSIGRSIAKKVDAAFFSLSAVSKGPQLPLGVGAYSLHRHRCGFGDVRPRAAGNQAGEGQRR